MKTNVKFKKYEGITLISLVVTIVVLLILAGVSISMLTGENGILIQAQNAKKETGKGSEKEQVQLSAIGALTKDNGGEIKRNYLDEELKNNIDGNYQLSEKAPYIVTIEETGRKYIIDANGNITGPVEEPEIIEPTGEGGKMDTMLYGVIEIKWLAGDTNYAVETPNAPAIKEDLPSGTSMKLVHYDEEGNVIYGGDYNYIAGKGTEDNTKSKWANAEVTIDNIKSYFVWIPRYAYKIIYFNSEETKNNYLTNGDTSGIIGYSDSRGIVDKDGKKISGVASEPSLNVGDYYRVHPAFTDDVDNGGWNEELEGIWVGKYESSLVEKTNSNVGITSETDIVVDKTNNTDKAITVRPGLSSWRNCVIENFYVSAKEYSTSLNSHMLKNSEWGAVAYLAESKYGRNGTEVMINNSKNTYITGSAQTITGTTDKYWSSEGMLASSTGNVTGIYDLSGGAYESVAIYYIVGNETYLNNGSSMINDYKNENNQKYVTAYTGINESIDYKPGDATYETKGWHSDYSSFVSLDYPFFKRGGHLGSGVNAGAFNFNGNNGTESSSSGFRMCLTIE